MGSTMKKVISESSGALGDIGTLLPLTLGAIGVAGLAPVPVLLGFAVFYIATGLYYRLPVPVQPMKAVAALLLTTQVSAQSLIASGVLIGAILLLLGSTGWINRAARLVPGSVLSGLQLGLGLLLASMGLELIATSLPLGLVVLGLLAVTLKLFPSWPAALMGLALAMVLGALLGSPGLPLPADPAIFSMPTLPSMDEWQQGFSILVLPQLALTITNAIVLTALVVGDYFGDQSHRSHRHGCPSQLAWPTCSWCRSVPCPCATRRWCCGPLSLWRPHRSGAGPAGYGVTPCGDRARWSIVHCRRARGGSWRSAHGCCC